MLHAWENVPYYRPILAESGVVRGGARSRVDLARLPDLPPLDRATLRSRTDDLQDRRPAGRRARRTWVRSGGTTGEPGRVLGDGVAYDHAIAAQMWFDGWTGYVPAEPKVVVWARLPRSRSWPRRRLERALGAFLRNEKRLPCNVLSADVIDAYLRRIERIRPVQILGYPTALYDIARRAEETGRRVPPPRAVVVSAEPLRRDARATIERVFRAPVFNRYGTDEVGNVACECGEQDGLHVSSLTHYIEVLGRHGRPAEPGEVGEVVVTLLTNATMPLIRYRIGDMGALAPPGDPCRCGRPFPRLRVITGRVSDAFVRPDGALVHGLYAYIYREIPWIEGFQVVQVAVDHVHVRLVARSTRPGGPAMAAADARPAGLAHIEAHLRAAMGETWRVTFEFLDRIPPAPSGKFRPTVSLVPR